MKQRQIVRQGRRVALAACGLLMGVWSLTSCEDNDLILTGQPSWLGNSIYERLQDEGTYTTTLKLIDDLGLKEVFSHTGSKTLFAASDSAYDVWFKTNSWGVRNYGQLSIAQKKLLLNNSMINNAYLIELMSNAKAQGDAATPEEGRTMRRETALSIYDSVYVMPVDKMPNTIYWDEFRERGKAMPLFKDATAAPMIHFLPAYMQYNKIKDEDLMVLTNGGSTSIADAWVNGKKVVERDITCKNGYIQKVSGVIESSPNMAEIIRSHANMSLWSHLLDRFSAPYYDASLTREYNRIYNNEDSVFVLRYFSDRSAGGNALERDPNGDPVKGSLSFDPGWNQYIDANSANNNDLHYDAGAMIVPTNEALEAWWNGEGSDLQDEYKVWDSIPDATLSKLLRVNMLSTFSEAVPTKFANVLNDAKESLGITTADVDSCFMGCNGVVYLTNKVFTPAEYSSVAYPALAHASTMNVIYWALSGGETGKAVAELNFLPYLLSMDSKYALIIPTNNAMLTTLDPSSYGTEMQLKDQSGADSATIESPDLIEFSYDMTKGFAQRVQAIRYQTTVDKDGNIVKYSDTPKQRQVGNDVIKSLLENLMNELIIVIPDKTKTLEDYIGENINYFKTKGGNMIRVTKGADGQLVFEGGWQIEHNDRPIPSVQRYPKYNGVSYQIETEVPMTAQNSLYMTLQKNEAFSAFLTILENDYCDLLTQKLSNKYNPGLAAKANKNLKLFDNYNYTVYIPTNESIRKLQADGYLPTDKELEMGDDDEVIDSICLKEGWYELGDRATIRKKVETAIKGIVNDFVRYHVQDNSLAVGMAVDPTHPGKYESMKRNLTTGRFYPLTAKSTATSLTVTDNIGNVRNVVTKPGLYNIICREYWFQGAGNNQRLFMGSDVVAHQIDGVLFSDTMKPWREVVKEALKK
jgi:hypothetical protein